MAYVARMHQYYTQEVVPVLQQRFGYRNVMQVPRLDKIVLNMGLGEAIQNPKLLDAGVEHGRFLFHEHDAAPQIVERDAAKIVPIDANDALVRIDEAKQQIRNRRLPAAARSDDGQRFACRDRERNVLQHLTASSVERHPIELDPPGETRQPQRRRRLDDVGRRVEQLVNACE